MWLPSQAVQVFIINFFNYIIIFIFVIIIILIAIITYSKAGNSGITRSYNIKLLEKWTEDMVHSNLNTNSLVISLPLLNWSSVKLKWMLQHLFGFTPLCVFKCLLKSAVKNVVPSSLNSFGDFSSTNWSTVKLKWMLQLPRKCSSCCHRTTPSFAFPEQDIILKSFDPNCEKCLKISYCCWPKTTLLLP